ncbi:LexA family transcriptional regulator [Nitratiruptor sp. SB155-2]|uniref:LexA family transcriptional regulator n=1 Tax=Nitratiruptor sp. (strain SB155-2) TaxID=387092 RepID=UPI0001586F49|nr:LexA family transcriptional regulator [Nitratiruptor sp. SB155-2]BAF69572.1 conserved hypothetical protein [Nitratiruptor sp. SB155-2]BAN05333.1 CI-like protein [Nitratiruptor phage NrS-1]
MSNKIVDKLQSKVNSLTNELSHWYERLKFFREKVLDIPQGEFAKRIDTDVTAVSRYERGAGAKKITYNIKSRLKDAFGEEVAQWIATGELPQIDQKSDVKPVLQTNESCKEGYPVHILSVRPSAGKTTNFEAIDIFDSGQSAIIDKIFIKKPVKGRLRAMQVDGYSMIPMLFPDSWVIVDETKEFTGDGLYVINFDNVLMVKLLEMNLNTGNLWVKSANPDYDSWEIKADDQRHFEIYGKVIRCII